MLTDQIFAQNRRAFLSKSTAALGTVALSQMMYQQTAQAAFGASPLHHPATADAVICLFQHGGPSQMDLFDHKPTLTKYHGQKYSGDLEIHFVNQAGNVLGSPFKFNKHGQAGIELSETLPHLGEIADDITLIRSVTNESIDHEAALRLIHGGKLQAGHPTWGSWVVYALGSENQNLPSYIVLSDPGGLPVDGVKNWSAGWLPAVYQGTPFRSGKAPVSNLQPLESLPPLTRQRQLQFVEELNRRHLNGYPGNPELQARLRNFEIAAAMQTTVPEALDLSQETEATQKMYGIDQKETEEYGRRCLIARRLIERGVRFVQLFMSGQPWDTHSKNAESLKGLCQRTDQPSAALVKDLKQRGLLDRTIVMWGGEFGRLPISQGADGRDHNRHANSIWFAGGGFKRGLAYGETDDFGYKATVNEVTVHDLHATLLHALGLDHKRLTYPHEGRPGSLTDVVVTKAKVVPEVLQKGDLSATALNS